MKKGTSLSDLRMEMVAQVGAFGALVIVAASFIYSFWNIKWVAEQLGPAEPPPGTAWLPFLFPFIIDVPALVASILIVALHGKARIHRIYAWVVLVVFITASWVCNGVHAVTYSQIIVRAEGEWWSYALVVLIAGFPPIGVVLGMHMWAYALRHSQAAEAPVPASTAKKRSRATKTADVKPAVVELPKGDAETADETEVPAPRSDDQARVLARCAEILAANPGEKPVAADIHRELGLTCNRATSRRWVQAAWDKHSAERSEESAAA
ncbi:hypothetical protein ABN028_19880 [Actinopolymorpha sp. B17G11]|uniref:hypothetical protein n=1 Tax=Actinopolymorpha sp. B17G11 TaxID=3160861 RepID=UPI0032E42371